MDTILVNWEARRKQQHLAVDAIIDENIRKSKESGLKKGMIICTSVEEFEQAKAQTEGGGPNAASTG
jgi:hypothetical protein